MRMLRKKVQEADDFMKVCEDYRKQSVDCKQTLNTLIDGLLKTDESTTVMPTTATAISDDGKKFNDVNVSQKSSESMTDDAGNEEFGVEDTEEPITDPTTTTTQSEPSTINIIEEYTAAPNFQ